MRAGRVYTNGHAYSGAHVDPDPSGSYADSDTGPGPDLVAFSHSSGGAGAVHQ